MPGDTKTDFSTLKWKTSLFKIAWIRSKRAIPKGQDPKGQNPDNKNKKGILKLLTHQSPILQVETKFSIISAFVERWTK